MDLTTTNLDPSTCLSTDNITIDDIKKESDESIIQEEANPMEMEELENSIAGQDESESDSASASDSDSEYDYIDNMLEESVNVALLKQPCKRKLEDDKSPQHEEKKRIVLISTSLLDWNNWFSKLDFPKFRTRSRSFWNSAWRMGRDNTF